VTGILARSLLQQVSDNYPSTPQDGHRFARNTGGVATGGEYAINRNRPEID